MTIPSRFLRMPEVCQRVGLKPTQIGVLERAGIFPRRIKISARASGWIESEVDAYMEARIAASRAQAAEAAA